MAVSFEVTGLNETMAAIRAAGVDAYDALGAALYQEGEQIITASAREVPVDEGILRASKFVEQPKKTAAGPEVTLGYGGSASGYAVFVHEGTGPAVGRPRYFPPVKALEGWAQRKLGDPNKAYAVARAIWAHGTKPTKFLERPFKQRMSGMSDRLAARIRARLERR